MLTFSSTECGQLVQTVRSNDVPQDTPRTSQEYGPKRQNIPLETPPETTDVQRFARVHGRHRKQSPRELIATDPTRDPMAPFNRVPSTNERSTRSEDDRTSGSSSSGVSGPRQPSPIHSQEADSRPPWAFQNDLDLEQEESE
jgi:hypothetical protein